MAASKPFPSPVPLLRHPCLPSHPLTPHPPPPPSPPSAGAPGLVTDPRAPEVMEWLDSCGLGVPVELTVGPMLEDPMRNGEVLCHLAQMLSGGDPASFYQPPEAMDQAEENLAAALETLQHCGLEIAGGERGARDVMARVMGGSWATILDLLQTVRRIVQRMGRMQAAPALAELDISRTVAFLSFVGIDARPGSESEPMFHSPLRSGAIFCLLATAVGRSTDVAGAVPRPRTEQDCRRNVTLGMAALELLPGVSVEDLSLRDLTTPTFVEVEGVLSGDRTGEAAGGRFSLSLILSFSLSFSLSIHLSSLPLFLRCAATLDLLHCTRPHPFRSLLGRPQPGQDALWQRLP